LSRGLGRGDPLNHCALNAVLYRPEGKRWALTERTRRDLARDAHSLSIGPSGLRWDGTALSIRIDERTAPIPSRLRGRVRVVPEAVTDDAVALDPHARHIWRPVAPRARIEVDFDRPRLRWSGNAYLDRNHGAEPLERAFSRWTWSRAHVKGETLVLYDAERRDGTMFRLAARFDGAGGMRTFALPPLSPLPGTLWRISRATRSDSGTRASLVRTLEDTPFYARSLVSTTLLGERVVAMHESLSLDRVANPMVRLMLPFRMPRWQSHSAVARTDRGSD
jgi:carotenoid 1,2-hydratase